MDRPRKAPGLVALVLLATTLATVGGCSRSGGGYPIPQEEITGVLVRVYLAEAEAELRGSSLPAARVEALGTMGYDTVSFNLTMESLARDPETAQDIYQAVLDSVIHEQRDIRGDFLAETE